VEPYTSPNPAAAGSITYVEQCVQCEAERDINSNGPHVELGPWGQSRAQIAAAQAARQADAQRRADQAAVAARGVVIRHIHRRRGYHTMISLEIDGRWRDVPEYLIVEAAAQEDLGDGLVPFYRGLLRQVRQHDPLD